jgi:hypothetical protein
MAKLLDSVRPTADETLLWDNVAERVAAALMSRKCRAEAAVLSPARLHVAACAEASSLLGMRVRSAAQCTS